MKKFLRALLFTSAVFLIAFFITCGRARGPSCGRCDNRLWAGAEAMKITPVVEPFTDVNGNFLWDQGEPFTDVNKNGKFDPVWIAGFGTGRLAFGVHDDLWARAIVLEYNAERVVLVAVDLVGYMANHIRDTKDFIEERLGIIPEEIVICSTHTHDGPDTIGRWGPSMFTTGLNKDYMIFVQEGVASAVEQAKRSMVPARVIFAKEDIQADVVRDGGGIGNPGRDPMIVDRTLLVMQVEEEQGGKTIASLINLAAHPEILWSENHFISSDFPHYLREEVEDAIGGVAIFIPGALGGMMTPNVSANTFEEAERFGRLIAREALAILKDAAPAAIQGIGLEYGYGMFPLDNREVMELAREFGLMDIPEERIIYSYDQCREKYGCREDEVHPCQEKVMISIGEKAGQEVMKGCAPVLIQAITLGHAQMVGAPGELFPELANGLPEDFLPFTSSAVTTRPNIYFPQHNPTDPLSQHADPYLVPVAVRDYMKGPYKFILGLANNEGGYIVPEADFNENVSIFDEPGDHYEETNSPGRSTAPVYLKKALEILERTGK